MMYKETLGCVLIGLLFISCKGVKPRIYAVCEEDEAGNTVVKWETRPVLEGEVKAFASTRPEDNAENNLAATVGIGEQRMTIAGNNPSLRYYYTLVFNDEYRVKVAPRNVVVPGIQNFRDLGGYPSYAVRKRLRWGKLYRSAAIDNLSSCAVQELKNLGIRTIIDLRTGDERQMQGTWTKNFNVVHIPVQAIGVGQTLEALERQTLQADTLGRVVMQMNRELAGKRLREYRQVFDVLLDSTSYPVVIECSSGNERTGIVSALVLSALGVNPDIIMDDYLLSNDYLDIPSMARAVGQRADHFQEAVTTLLSAREPYLDAARDETERMYGKVETYLQEGVGLDKKEIKALQNLLLVPME